MSRAVERYELLVAFSSRMDDWGMISTPDDFDERSHDQLVTEYRTRYQARGLLERADAMPDHHLLVDYANWLDDNGGMRTCGPRVSGLEEAAERFLKEHGQERSENNV